MMLQFPGCQVGRGIIAVLHHTAAVEKKHFQTFFRQFFGCPAAANAGTDNNGIVVFFSAALVLIESVSPAYFSLWCSSWLKVFGSFDVCHYEFGSWPYAEGFVNHHGNTTHSLQTIKRLEILFHCMDNVLRQTQVRRFRDARAFPFKAVKAFVAAFRQGTNSVEEGNVAFTSKV
jgi:hypothetical protein